MGIKHSGAVREEALLHQVDHALHGFTLIDRVGNHRFGAGSQSDCFICSITRDAIGRISIVWINDDFIVYLDGEEVVRTEEKKLNAMVESITEGVVMTDDKYRVMVANPAAKKALALDKKEVTIFDFIDNFEGKFDIRGKLEESVKLDKILFSPDILIRDRFYQITVAPVKSSMGVNKKEILA